jgi:hypothetical protein
MKRLTLLTARGAVGHLGRCARRLCEPRCDGYGHWLGHFEDTWRWRSEWGWGVMAGLDGTSHRAAMRFAYADPPYIGQAQKHYRKHADFGGEVDHAELVDRLVAEYPDGWALSLSCKSLQAILALCPPDVRVLAWTKRGPALLPGIRLQYGWEPVIMRGGRQGGHTSGDRMHLDWVCCQPEGYTFRPPPPGHIIGRKPEAFSRWLFDCLGAEHGDSLDDLYPGTGAVGQAWARFTSETRLAV